MNAPPPPLDIVAFIATNLPLLAVPAVPEISLHTAQPASGLRRLRGDDEDAPPPYWAYQWAGGTVLARYILDQPQSVAGKTVLDCGAGGGIVGIAAAKAGARQVTAIEIDPHGVIAIALNAKANGVTITALCDDPLDGPPPSVDLVLVGDLFYAPDLAARTLPYLERCRAAGIEVLIGDPFRLPLPRERLRLLAQYQIPDFGGGSAPVAAGVFTLA